MLGSSTVTSYSNTPGASRVKRSTRRRSAVAPPRMKLVSRRKLAVSTTSVSPSQRPRDSPAHCRRPLNGRPSSGMTRGLWFISL